MKTGKKPAVNDDRVPRMSAVTRGRLPAPPPASNWYAAVGTWGMLLNDQLSCCVPAAILHSIRQMSTYAGRLLAPTDDEVRLAYEAAGYDPQNPASDQGSYVLGETGLVPYWHQHGFVCGGEMNKVGSFMQIKRPNPIEWRQAIWLFGGILVGIRIPEKIVEQQPFIWDDSGAPIAGGHEIWIPGYLPASGSYTDSSGPALYDVVSWGAMYRATEQFLLDTVDEVVAVVNPVEMNARGLNAADYNLAQLEERMKLLV